MVTVIRYVKIEDKFGDRTSGPCPECGAEWEPIPGQPVSPDSAEMQHLYNCAWLIATEKEAADLEAAEAEVAAAEDADQRHIDNGEQGLAYIYQHRT